MLISNCRSGINPSAGDQSGDEWRIQNWYAGSWDVVLRFPNSSVANLISNYARHAASNNHCGYSQANRLTFWNKLSSVLDPANITEDCDADCSSSTAAIIKAVGRKLGISALANVNASMTTFNMREALIGVGFAPLTGTYCTSDAQLQAGDIILDEDKHVCIAVAGSDLEVDGAVSVDDTSSTTAVATMSVQLPLLKYEKVKAEKREDTLACQTLLNLRGADIEADGYYGAATLNAVKIFQAQHSLTADGECGAATWKCLIEG